MREQAKAAVSQFEEEYRALRDMRNEFSTQFPDAAEALAEIKAQEDRVAEAINHAKNQVAQAKVTIGEFLCKRAFSQPGYDDSQLTDIILNHPERDTLFSLLAQAGVITGLKTDRAAAAVFAAQNPQDGAPLQPAWKDKEELTPRVTTPKVL
jgi:predicted Zn-dependent protease